MKKIQPVRLMLMMLLGLVLAGGALIAAEQSKPINSKCPMSGKSVDAEKTSQYTVQFCCGKCKAKFDKNPAAYTQKVAHAEEGKCPMSGKDVDEEKSSTVTVGFCCGKCKAKFDKDPKKYIGKVNPS